MAILFPVVFIMDFRLLGATVRNGEPSAPGMVPISGSSRGRVRKSWMEAGFP